MNRDGRRAALLIGAVFAGSLWLASSFPLIDPDEGRNAEVAREMLAIGDPVIPHLAGMPYLDKPPALFWAQGVAFRIFGATPFAARLPAAVAAALILWMVGRFALAHADPRRALTVIAWLATAPLFAVLSAYVIFDMLLAACVTAVWIAVARETLASEAAARSGAPPPRPPRWPGIHFALALGVLVKGPVMLAWALGGSLAAALCARSRAPLQWIGRWQGWLLFLLIAGGWFALALERHPEYLRYAFVDESLRRMTTSAFAREQPPWFVPVVLAAGALPWSLATPWGRGLGVVSRVGLGFVLFAAVFFTLSRSKLVTYLLPALPMLAWIAAEAWSGRRRAALGAVRLCIVFVALALTALLFGAREGWWGARLAPELVAHGMAAARGVALACVALAGLAFLAARGPRPGLAVLAAALFTPALLVIGGAAGARFARAESGEPLAGAILAHDARARVRYEHCYSPGTDFLLGRGGWFVSETGHEFTSNYQIYYRETLEARGLWVPSRRAEDAPPAGVIVRPARRRDLEPPDGWVEFHRDRRFVAYHPGPERR